MTRMAMLEKDYSTAKKLKEKLAKAVPLVDMKVFGSRARGDHDEYSDMDVFIEVERLDGELKKKIRAIAWEVGFEHAVHISTLIFTRQELEKSPLRSSPIVTNIYEEGLKV